MSPVVDFSKATELQALPKDEYSAVLESWEYKEKTATSKDDYVVLKFAVNDGSEYDGRSLFRNFSLLDNSLWAFKQALVRLGANKDELNESLDLEDVLPPLVGAPCRLKVDVREYEDKDTEEKRIVNDVQQVLQVAF